MNRNKLQDGLLAKIKSGSNGEFKLELGGSEVFQALLSKDMLLPMFYTLLEAACEKGNADIVNILLSYDGVDVNQHYTMTYMTTVLFTAAYYGNVEVVKVLLDRPNVNISVKNDGGLTAFHMAAMSGSIEIMKLLSHRPDFQLSDTYVDCETALMCAARKGRMGAVKFLLQLYPLSVITQKYYGDTASDEAENEYNDDVAIVINEFISQNQ